MLSPPRRGIGAELSGWLEGSGVRSVVYSSCNPKSLAHDLARMPSYRIRTGRVLAHDRRTHRSGVSRAEANPQPHRRTQSDRDDRPEERRGSPIHGDLPRVMPDHPTASECCTTHFRKQQANNH